MHLITDLLYLEKCNKVCKAHPLVIGHAPPAKRFDFRTSEIVSGAILG